MQAEAVVAERDRQLHEATKILRETERVKASTHFRNIPCGTWMHMCFHI